MPGAPGELVVIRPDGRILARLDATAPERREMFLTRLVLPLAVDGGDTEAFRRAVETAVLPG